MGKVIIVTGGNRGIGYEICRQLAASGHRVVLTARTVAKGEEARQRLLEENITVVVKSLDVADPQSISRFADEIGSEFSRVDVLINNAGILQDSKYSVSDIPEGILRDIMNVNFYGPFLLAQALLPLIRRSDDGRIVNVSSGMGAMSEMGGGYPAYRTSKAALNAFTKVLSAEEGGAIKVNSMCPGWVRTDMGGTSAPRSVAQGAETAVWLAVAPEIPNGAFVRDKRQIAW